MEPSRLPHETAGTRTVASAVTGAYLRARGPLYGVVAAAGLLLAPRWGTGPLVTGVGAAVLALHAIIRHRSHRVTAIMAVDATAIGLSVGTSGRLEIALPMALVMLTVAVLAAPPRYSPFFVGYVLFWLVLAYVLEPLGWPAIVEPGLRRFWAVVFAVISVALTIVLLRAAARALARADRLRVRLIGAVSHDLRNPLSVVLGAAELLTDPDLTEEERGEMRSMILDQGAEARRIVEDLLATVRIEAGHIDMFPGPVALATEIPRIVAGLDSRGVIRFLPSPTETTVVADPVRLSQIVGNLVTNALRYGGPDVAVAWSESEGAASLVVSDDGEGVPAADFATLFEPFAPAGAGRTTPGSVGLGLSLARELARLMGGELTYGRAEDRTELTLRLPLSESAPAVSAGAE